MRSLSHLLLALCAAGVCGCQNEAQTYARQHAELTAAQRDIFTRSRITAGDAVAGLTHDQVKLAMHGYPATFDRINGQEAWVYVRKKSVGRVATDDDPIPGNFNYDKPNTFTTSDHSGPRTDVNEKTTILFQGDRAIRAEVTQEKP